MSAQKRRNAQGETLPDRKAAWAEQLAAYEREVLEPEAVFLRAEEENPNMDARLREEGADL